MITFIANILGVILTLIVILFFIVLWFTEDKESNEYSSPSERQKRNDNYDNNTYI